MLVSVCPVAAVATNPPTIAPMGPPKDLPMMNPHQPTLLPPKGASFSQTYSVVLVVEAPTSHNLKDSPLLSSIFFPLISPRTVASSAAWNNPLAMSEGFHSHLTTTTLTTATTPLTAPNGGVNPSKLAYVAELLNPPRYKT